MTESNIPNTVPQFTAEDLRGFSPLTRFEDEFNVQYSNDPRHIMTRAEHERMASGDSYRIAATEAQMAAYSPHTGDRYPLADSASTIGMRLNHRGEWEAIPATTQAEQKRIEARRKREQEAYDKIEREAALSRLPTIVKARKEAAAYLASAKAIRSTSITQDGLGAVSIDAVANAWRSVLVADVDLLTWAGSNRIF